MVIPLHVRFPVPRLQQRRHAFSALVLVVAKRHRTSYAGRDRTVSVSRSCQKSKRRRTSQAGRWCGYSKTGARRFWFLLRLPEPSPASSCAHRTHRHCVFEARQHASECSQRCERCIRDFLVTGPMLGPRVVPKTFEVLRYRRQRPALWRGFQVTPVDRHRHHGPCGVSQAGSYERTASESAIGSARARTRLGRCPGLTRDRPPGYSHGSNRPLAAVPE